MEDTFCEVVGGQLARPVSIDLLELSVERASRVVDSLETRNDVDPERIGLEGVSLGGYYCPVRSPSSRVWVAA